MHGLYGRGETCSVRRSELVAACEGKVCVRSRGPHGFETRYPGMNISAALVARLGRGDRYQERGKTLGELLLQIPLQFLIAISRQSNDGACPVACGAAQHSVDRGLGSLTQNIEQ